MLKAVSPFGLKQKRAANQMHCGAVSFFLIVTISHYSLTAAFATSHFSLSPLAANETALLNETATMSAEGLANNFVEMVSGSNRESGSFDMSVFFIIMLPLTLQCFPASVLLLLLISVFGIRCI